MAFKRFAPVVLVCALLIGGCTSNKPSSQQTPSGSSTASNKQIPVVKSSDSLFFTPKVLSVSRGQSVSFMNPGSVSHTVTSDNGAPVAFDQALDAGTTITINVFTRPGSYRFHCKIHPQMTGVIVVI